MWQSQADKRVGYAVLQKGVGNYLQYNILNGCVLSFFLETTEIIRGGADDKYQNLTATFVEQDGVQYIIVGDNNGNSQFFNLNTLTVQDIDDFLMQVHPRLHNKTLMSFLNTLINLLLYTTKVYAICRCIKKNRCMPIVRYYIEI